MSTINENRYRADLRDVFFLLFEQLRLEELLGKPPFEDWGTEEVKAVIAGGYKFACEVFGPINASGDAEGCRVEKGQVYAPKGFREAFQNLYESGWKVISVPKEWDGQGAPRVVQASTEEFLAGSNTALTMYSGLTHGVAEIVHAFGTPAQKEVLLKRLYHGVWSGTMCLTEPHAGSDVGASRSTATKNADGTYNITGTKIFISAGDHDFTDNIIHAVLARVEGAPPGTKGLSLFFVPKYRINKDGSRGEPNDVSVGRIEHKMGINGSATCVLNFGENGKCVGDLVGGVENAGMSQMFRMMNEARIGVGIQGLAVAAGAYLNALDYSRTRKQGANMKQWKDASAPRVPILEHGDVRRMLLDMKARVEGLRALIFKLIMHEDRRQLVASTDDAMAHYHHGQVELLTPIVKAYTTDQGFRVCETAIQVYGGAGYTKDYPVEQCCRDSKIFSIYEGTNHIQAMDLVGRKLGQNGGKHMQDFINDVSKFAAETKSHPTLGPSAEKLEAAVQALGGFTMQLMGWFSGGQLEIIPLVANRFLERMGEVCVGWMLLEQARIAEAALPKVAEGHPDKNFYLGKRAAAIYFANTELAVLPARIAALTQGDMTPMSIPDEAFATV